MRHLIFIFILFFSLKAIAQKPISPLLTLTSPNFVNQSKLPANYTCDGEDVSPTLTWTSLPPNTKTLTLIVSDPDAPNGVFYHWVVYNIPKTATSLPEGAETLPQGAIQGKNSSDLSQYKGACPPKGETHHYVFTLYALDTKIDLPAAAEPSTVLKTIENHVIEKTELVATYNR